MKKEKLAGQVKSICCFLMSVCIAVSTGNNCLFVGAMEEHEQNELATEEITLTQEESEESESEEQELSQVNHTDEEVETENTQKDVVESEREIDSTNRENIRLKAKNLSRNINDCTVEVEGKIPENAELYLQPKEISKKVKERIVGLSGILDSQTDFEQNDIEIFSYDISLIEDGLEYEPYLFDEKVNVYFSADVLQKNVSDAEIFHVGENDDVEQLSILEITDEQMTFETDHFSQFIILVNTTYNKTSKWEYSYLGERERLEIPSKGIYEIRLYGAQGENSESYEGGRGGFICIEKEFNKGDVVEFEVGGQDGYKEAGRGTETSGGGSTKVFCNGSLVAIAGGGGGALVNRDGGAGGTIEHKNDIQNGADSEKEHSAGGGAGYKGGIAGYVTYHVHEGNENEKAGCYTKPVYHAHTSSCFGIVCGHGSLTWLGVSYDSTGDDYSDWRCNGCNRVFVSNTTYGEPSPSPTYGWICKQDGKIIGYDLECGMTTKTIVGSEPSYGGSNYCADDCQEQVSQSGIRVGNGFAQIELKQLDSAAIRFENDGYEYKTYYVEKGTEYADDSMINPTKREDERFSYEFLGWDNLDTNDEETLSTSEAFLGKHISDKYYRAIYRKIPQKYTITLQSNASAMKGTREIIASYGERMQDIVVPQKEGYIFAGYYRDVNDEGTKYYDAYGKAIRHSDFTCETNLEAKWEDPLSIVKSPQNEMIVSGYSGVVLETQAKLTSENGYRLQYQWYVNNKEMLQDATQIKEGFTNKLIVPQGYKVGTYYFFCKVTVEGSVEQKIEKYTDIAKVEVTKGNLSNESIRFINNRVTYDGTYHPAIAEVKNDSDAKIYYGKEQLSKENYKTKGSISPLSYKDAGKYKVYTYIESENYDDMSAELDFEIMKGQPIIYLASKNTTYKEGENQSIEEAVIEGVNPKDVEKITVEYTYYTDEQLTKKTQKEHGANREGGEPSEIGTYFVVAKTKETSNYESVSTKQSAMLNILGSGIAYSVTDYIGAYDGEFHGLTVYIADATKERILFSDSEKLTRENYLDKGTEKPYQYKNAGTYTIHYAIVSKLTNSLDNVMCATAKIQINKAQRELGKDIPSVNSDYTLSIPQNTKWEYKKTDLQSEWEMYVPGTKLSFGKYEMRIPEDENYCCSETVTIPVQPPKSSGSESGDTNHGNDTEGDQNGNGNGGDGQSGTAGKPNLSDSSNTMILDNLPNVIQDEDNNLAKLRQNRGNKTNIVNRAEEISVEKYDEKFLSTTEGTPNSTEEKILFKTADEKDDKSIDNLRTTCYKFLAIGFVGGLLFIELLLLLIFLLFKKRNEKKTEEYQE